MGRVEFVEELPERADRRFKDSRRSSRSWIFVPNKKFKKWEGSLHPQLPTRSPPLSIIRQRNQSYATPQIMQVPPWHLPAKKAILQSLNGCMQMVQTLTLLRRTFQVKHRCIMRVCAVTLSSVNDFMSAVQLRM